LEKPLEEIIEAARGAGHESSPCAPSIRTGDTPASVPQNA